MVIAERCNADLTTYLIIRYMIGSIRHVNHEYNTH